jgi:anthranilate phosphoribosyltransferase
MATRMLGTLRVLGTERAMVFSGDDGLDELTTTTTSTVHELVDGNLHEFKIDPLDVGIPRSEAAQLCGGDAATNAGVLRDVLQGVAGPCRDIAVLNAAAALMVAGKATDLAAGVEMAVASIDKGAANKALDTLVRVSQTERAAEEESA